MEQNRKMLHLEGPEGAERVQRGGERVQVVGDASRIGTRGRASAAHRGHPRWAIPPSQDLESFIG